MDPEERLDLADMRLNAHAVQLATFSANLQNICDDTRDMKKCMEDLKKGQLAQTKELIAAVQPVKDLTQSNNRAIIGLTKDVGWIKPWVKRSMIVGGGASVAGILTLLKLFT